MAEATEPVTNLTKDQVHTEVAAEETEKVDSTDSTKKRKKDDDSDGEGKPKKKTAKVTQEVDVTAEDAKDTEVATDDMKKGDSTDSTKKRKKGDDSDVEEQPKKSAKVTKADLTTEEKDDAAEGETTTAPIEEVTMGEGEAQAGAANDDDEVIITGEKTKDGKQTSNAAPRPKPMRKIISRFDQMPESRDADEIRTQVEFYFGDSNLPTDTYLFGLAGGCDNQPVDVSVIHSFKRMQRFQPRSAIIDALKESETLDIDDRGGITRKVPLDDKKYGKKVHQNKIKQLDDSMSRSVYVKGFGREIETTHQDIEKYLMPYGPTKSIRLRRWDDGEFKGSVLVEFASEQLQVEFLALKSLPKFEGRDTDGRNMSVKTMEKYLEQDCGGDYNKLINPVPTSNHRGGFKGNPHQHRDRDARAGNGGGGKGGANEKRRHNKDPNYKGYDRYDREDGKRQRADKGYKGDRMNFRKRREHEEESVRKETEAYEAKDLMIAEENAAKAQLREANEMKREAAEAVKTRAGSAEAMETEAEAEPAKGKHATVEEEVEA